MTVPRLIHGNSGGAGGTAGQGGSFGGFGCAAGAASCRIEVYDGRDYAFCEDRRTWARLGTTASSAECTWSS